MMDFIEDDHPITVEYVNYRGEKSTRTIRPISLRYGSSRWHAEEQWLMEALDLKRGLARSFALKDMRIRHKEE